VARLAAGPEPLLATRRTKDFKTCKAPATPKAPDTRARDERITAYLDLVKSIATDIRGRPLGRGVDLDDLVAYGRIGLVEAATRFEERGVPFSVFARPRIYGAIVDGIRTQHWFGRRADRRLRVDRVGHDWQVAVGADHHARNDVRRNGRPMVCPRPEAEDVTEQVAVALQGLPVLERRVVELHHYEEKTITQAAKELRIGRPRASRLHARALVALRAAVENATSYPYRPEASETAKSRRADLDAVRPRS
jgi:RNA polymerase sigma factor for flagellar operon FliA